MIIEVKNDSLNLINELQKEFSNILGNVLDDMQNNPFSHYIVYLKDEKIVGYINYYLMYDRAEIANFNVLEEAQGQRIGTKLINYLITILNGKTANISLEVKEDNLRAIHLYEKVGFIMKCKVVKSKVCNPMGECEIPCFFDRGFVSFDDVKTIRKELMKQRAEEFGKRVPKELLEDDDE